MRLYKVYTPTGAEEFRADGFYVELGVITFFEETGEPTPPRFQTADDDGQKVIRTYKTWDSVRASDA